MIALIAVELLWRRIERPNEGLVPLLEAGVDFEAADLTSYGGLPIYTTPFSSDWP